MAAVKAQRHNSSKNSGQTADISMPSPGKRLQKAREAMGMEVATVAEQLHLSKTMVHALEEENYEVLPARVFVRGYYRNFARLVGVPEEVVLREFSQRCPEGEDCSVIPAAAQGVRKEIRSSHSLVRLTTWLIAAALITVFGLWLKSYLDKGDVTEKSVPENQPAVAAEKTSLTESTQAPSPTPVVAEVPELEQMPQEINLDTETVAAAEESAASAEDADSSVKLVQKKTSQQSTASPKVWLMFSGDCWVDVRDSTRSFKLVGTRQAGEKYELKGKPPYKMVLGNASNVSIMIDGEPFDLTPFTQDNVAKLTFNPTTD
ncbi:MAG TPA: helix-turn-helix domain-containing protein [Thiolapillus brandeum]|uniref:Helix-turn-helix domain-containing protein n=1 Tax=Thiolapillus brandeum TaxID=1076588 RepID=A0A831K823_9GAMM|nr:helix-turn-helix domain-containing protein [Thiolapillus brandeum]